MPDALLCWWLLMGKNLEETRKARVGKYCKGWGLGYVSEDKGIF